MKTERMRSGEGLHTAKPDISAPELPKVTLWLMHPYPCIPATRQSDGTKPEVVLEWVSSLGQEGERKPIASQQRTKKAAHIINGSIKPSSKTFNQADNQ